MCFNVIKTRFFKYIASVNNFLQLIFEDIVGEILVHQTTITKDNADKEQSMISNNDQSILYYIQQ
jgi:hypothetical protein